VRRLDSLVEMRTMEENRLSSGIAVAAVRQSVEELIAHLSEQIRKTEALIRSHIDSHPGLKQQRELLDSIPGVGEATAAALLAEVPDLKQYKSAREVAAFAGLVPRERRSGGSVRGRVRLSKIGNARLRKALYFPAVTALRCSPFFQQWAEGLRQRGKSKMAVIGDAQARPLGLRRAQDRQAVRPRVGEESLTSNTVSHPRPCTTYMRDRMKRLAVTPASGILLLHNGGTDRAKGEPAWTSSASTWVKSQVNSVPSPPTVNFWNSASRLTANS
jgi:hypothetical protein